MKTKILIILSLIFLIHVNASSQARWNYISPMPGSGFVNPENNIALRHGEVIKRNGIGNLKFIVSGSLSGGIDGKMKISNDLKTVIFEPENPFQPGETVTVTVPAGFETEEGIRPGDTTFSFEISQEPRLFQHNETRENLNQHFPGDHFHRHDDSRNTDFSSRDQLPEDMPPLQITRINNPSDGYLFLTSGAIGDYSNYVRIVDNTGTPIFYRKFPKMVRDFKVTTGNRLVHSYGDYTEPSQKCYLVYNATYQVVDTLRMENGYSVDNHEVILLENGNRIMMAYDFHLVGMDTVVPGGNPQATVEGLVIQEIDSSDNVILQWRSWDHFLITDAVGLDLTAQIIDYVHGNSIEIDDDENLLISSRHMNEITKIDRNTGEIIWRFGPNAKNNMFTWENDTVGFTYQHDLRRTAAGTITLYDNGNLHNPQFSQALEYDLDETNLTATKVWNYKNDPVIYASAAGSSRRLENGNTIIGWGAVSTGDPTITEVTPDGEITLEGFYPFWVFSYRVVKEVWETTAFDFNLDSIHYDSIQPGDTATRQVLITNNMTREIEINNMVSRTGLFLPYGEFPLTIPPGETRELTVGFSADSLGIYHDVLTICNDIEADTLTQRIAKQIEVVGEIVENSGVSEFQKPEFRISANPVSDYLTIQYLNTGYKEVALYTVQGQQISHFRTTNSTSEIDFRGLPSGIYFLKVIQENGAAGTAKIIKK